MEMNFDGVVNFNLLSIVWVNIYILRLYMKYGFGEALVPGKVYD